MNAFGMNKEEFHRWFEELMYPTLPYRSIDKDYSASKNVNNQICAECGGECCKRCGCHFSPDDFQEISFDFLKKELEKGYISIDFVDGEMIYQNFGIYILRARNKDAPIVDLGYKRSPCILLTEKGCKLDYEHRPTGGRLLIPSNKCHSLFGVAERRCNSTYSIDKCCYEWKSHQKLLHNLVEYFKDKEITCSL